MALDANETVVVEEAPAEPIVENIEETPVEKPEGELETPEVAKDVEVVEGEEVVEEKVEDVPEPVTFDATLETPVLLEKVNETLDKYELPQEVQAAIDVLTAKVNEPSDSFAPYADYGTVDDIKVLLDRQVLIDGVEKTDDGFKPTTYKFADDLHARDSEKSAWLYYDLGRQKSAKYAGTNITQFEEGIVDLIGQKGETVQTALERYHKTIEFMRSGVIPTIDAPEFVPPEVREAYLRMSETEKNWLGELDPTTDQDLINQKLSDLRLIQNGIDGDKRDVVRIANGRAVAEQTINNEIVSTQVKFYDAFRETFTADLIANVKFSEDPKVQALEAHRSLALLTQAFDDTGAGAAARQILNDSGIEFNYDKAKKLVNDVEAASILLVKAQKTLGPDGKPIDQIALNKAQSQFKTTTGEWQTFAKDILDQESTLASTGKAEEVKAAVEKVKVPLKARPGTNGVGTAAKKAPEVNPHPYGSPAADKWYAQRTIQEIEARKAAMYQPA